MKVSLLRLTRRTGRFSALSSPYGFTPGNMLAALALTVFLCACAGSGNQTPLTAAMLREMSTAGRVSIYDAENEIAIALGLLDEARDKIADQKAQRTLAEKRLDGAAIQRNPLGVSMMEAWLAYLDALDETQEMVIRWRESAVAAARVNLEVVKAEIIHREDLSENDENSLQALRKEYQRQNERTTAIQKRIEKQRRTITIKERAWWKARRRFVSATGNHQSGLWTD